MPATRPADTPTLSAGSFEVSPQQIAFFETFGFLTLPGLFERDIPVIRAGFEEVFAREQAQILDPANEFHRPRDPQYRDQPRSIIPGFLDKSEKLQWLRDDPRVNAIARALLGVDFVYAESDGNVINCDVYWHVDAYGALAAHEHIKLFFYLDPLRRDEGALRMIPGTQFGQGNYAKALRKDLTLDPDRVTDVYGVECDQIPSWTLEVEPGDVIVGNFKTIHASFNGAVGRRLFTVNFGARRAETVSA